VCVCVCVCVCSGVNGGAVVSVVCSGVTAATHNSRTEEGMESVGKQENGPRMRHLSR
jgi:hypothetical protein